MFQNRARAERGKREQQTKLENVIDSIHDYLPVHDTLHTGTYTLPTRMNGIFIPRPQE